MKKRVILILLLIAILLGRIIYLNYNQLTLLWNLNSVEVTVDKPLNSDKIKIEYGVSANYYNRFIIDSIPHREKYTVLIFDGEYKNEVPYEYGENDFLITYDNKYYLTFRHFKTNWRRHHDYNFHFYLKDNKIFIHTDIKGFYNEAFDKPMLELNTK
jgi:hypothetical protein